MLDDMLDQGKKDRETAQKVVERLPAPLRGKVEVAVVRKRGRLDRIVVKHYNQTTERDGKGQAATA